MIGHLAFWSTKIPMVHTRLSLSSLISSLCYMKFVFIKRTRVYFDYSSVVSGLRLYMSQVMSLFLACNKKRIPWTPLQQRHLLVREKGRDQIDTVGFGDDSGLKWRFHLPLICITSTARSALVATLNFLALSDI
jgi:hypothetical protein